MNGDAVKWLPYAKPAIATGLLIVLWVLEAVVPMYGGRERRLSHGAANVALGLFNAVVAAVLLGATFLAVTDWAQEHSFGMLHWLPSAIPTWVLWIVGLVLFDAWMYLWHVLNHRVPLLWRFHAVHHTDRELDVSSAMRFHTGEILLSGVSRLVILPVIGMTMPQLLLYELFLLPVIFFHHSNVRLPQRIDRRLCWFIVTPGMHWVHHSRLRQETNSNYASVLPIWDRLFGTYCCRDDLLDEVVLQVGQLPTRVTGL